MSYSSSTGGERLPRRGTRCRSLAHHNITPTPSPSFSGNIPASRVRNSRASIGAHTAIVPQTGRNIGCCTGFLGDLVPLSVGNGLQLPARSPRPGDFDRDLEILTLFLEPEFLADPVCYAVKLGALRSRIATHPSGRLEQHLALLAHELTS